MFVLILLLLITICGFFSAITFDDYDDLGLLKCNWALAYLDDAAIINDPGIQHEIMLLSSQWEGRFSRHGIGADLDKGILSSGCSEVEKYGCVADYDTGLIHSCSQGRFEIFLDTMHMALLALALNGSPYASQFFRSSMQTYWNGTLETFLIDQLTKKIDFYEYVNKLYPGFSGLFDSFQWNDTVPYPDSNVVYMRTVSYMAWPLLAISRLLAAGSNTENAKLSQRYHDYAALIADNFLTIFYRGGGDFNHEMTVVNISSPPSPDNYVPDDMDDAAVYPFLDELTLYFAQFFVNWTQHGGDTEIRKMWLNLKDNIKKTPYELNDTTVIEVESSFHYTSTERFKYLYLPYLDVKEQEHLHFFGELARTHYSAKNRIPGLFTEGWMYVDPYDYKEANTICGIISLGVRQCEKSDHVCPSAAFPMILQPKMRGIGLAWYLTMLRSPKMQGPFGILACVKLPSAWVSVSMKWDSKLFQLLAFDGGLASIVRDILNDTGQLEQFYAIVRDNIEIFENSNSDLEEYHLYMPTAPLQEQTQRFNACSAQNYTRSMSQFPTSAHQSQANGVLGRVGIISACLLLTSFICIVGAMRYAKRAQLRKRNAFLCALSKSARVDTDWEVGVDCVSMENEPIGRGAFAIVYKGILKELPRIFGNNGSRFQNEAHSDKQIVVAIKCPANETTRLEFEREIEFMKTIGYHSRLVNMLACISGTEKQKLVLEFCANGDLLQYLRDVHEEIKTTTTFTVKNLISFAWQINEGMIYLSSKNLVHRDLSARNILLTDDNCAKISDFGLARTLIDDEYKSNGGMLPFRILSPEAISRSIYSIKSDVWAYGVLLYEIFSLGNTPYSNMSEASIQQFLIAENRLEQPKHAADSIYDLMKMCWRFESCERPLFAQIGEILRTEMTSNAAAYGYLTIDSTVEQFLSHCDL